MKMKIIVSIGISTLLLSGCGVGRSFASIDYIDGGKSYKTFEIDKMVYFEIDKSTFDLAEKIKINASSTDNRENAKYIISIKQPINSITGIKSAVTRDSGGLGAVMYYYDVNATVIIEVKSADGKVIDKFQSGGSSTVTMGNKFVNNNMSNGDIYRVNNNSIPLFLSNVNYQRFLSENEIDIRRTVQIKVRDDHFSKCLDEFNEKYFYGTKSRIFYVLDGGRDEYIINSKEIFNKLKEEESLKDALKKFSAIAKNSPLEEDRAIAANNAGVVCVKLKKKIEAAAFFDQAASSSGTISSTAISNSETLKDIEGKL